MAWNPAPEVAAARDFGKRFGARRVVILFESEDGRIGYASYGKTRVLCDETKGVADAAYEAFGESLAELRDA